jgi:hypothetical protein
LMPSWNREIRRVGGLTGERIVSTILLASG